MPNFSKQSFSRFSANFLLKIAAAIAILGSAGSAGANENSAVLKSALEAQADCQSFVRFDATNLYLGFASGVRVVPLDGSSSFDIQTDSPRLIYGLIRLAPTF